MAPQETATAEVTIVLADDHSVVRQGLRALAAAEPGFRVVGDAAGGKDAVRLVKSLGPAVLVLDVAMPDMNGFEVAEKLADQAPDTAIVMLSMYANPSYVAKALRCGATGYVAKDAPSEELVKAIHLAAEGKRYLSAGLDEAAVDALLADDEGAADPWSRLTARERQVVELITQGLTSKEIGERLDISVRTAEKHRENLMGKLGLKLPTQLVRQALDRDLRPPAP